MITVTAYAGKIVGVFGLGKAGEATIASLLAGGAEVIAWDDGEAGRIRAGGRFPQITMLPVAQGKWEKIEALILSPGVPLTHPAPHESAALAKQHGKPVIGDIELLFNACPQARYVSITGTNGKSTTTTLIGHILQEAGLRVEVGGNLGTPALSLEPLDSNGVYVLELSSYQLDLVRSTRFNAALLLNITPDHLDRHGDMDGYIAAKMHIFDRQQADDVAIIAVDDDYTRTIASRLQREGRNVVETSVSGTTEIAVEDGVLYDHGAPVGDLRGIATLTGRHNWQNAAAAYAAARACGVAPEAIYHAMQSFAGLRHRLQLAATIRGVRFINDSKATNADATSHALAPYDAIYWIAGGKPKAGGIESLSAYFPKITHAFLIGAAEDEFAATLEGKTPYTRSHTLAGAVQQAAQMAFAQNKPGAVVLLSPACASFDQFKSFEERGDVFCQLVDSLAAQVIQGEGKAYAS